MPSRVASLPWSSMVPGRPHVGEGVFLEVTLPCRGAWRSVAGQPARPCGPVSSSPAPQAPPTGSQMDTV
jgi:hypothetical protein